MLTAGIAGGQVERFWNALPWMYLSAIVVAATVGWLHSRRALVLSAIAIAVASVALEHAGWLWGAAGPRASGWPPRFLHHVVWVLTVPDLLTVTLADRRAWSGWRCGHSTAIAAYGPHRRRRPWHPWHCCCWR